MQKISEGWIMLEKTVEKYLCDRVRATGGNHRKMVFPAHRGAPDRLVGWDGLHIMIELKRPKGKGAEDHQQREHKWLRSIGIDVRVIHTKEDVDAFIAEMTE